MERARAQFSEASLALDHVPIVSNLLREEKIDILMAAEVLNFSAGDKVFSEGDDADTFFILTSGTVKLASQQDSTQLKEAKAPAYFGEVGIIQNTQRRLTATVVSPAATV